MAIVQCKMCGGELNLPPNFYSGTCPYCGTMSTFPKLDTEEIELLYKRAEHYRRTCNFDLAITAYENVVKNNPNDPEAYWGIVISRFGIEYVVDPLTEERIPTCHRVQYDSILDDDDYKETLAHANDVQKDIYRAAAEKIAEIQKRILEISAREKPYDIFICYKETDENNERTQDSVLGMDIYEQLTAAGYRVFFARITLESKLGTEYEPIIFGALNSAKAMLVLGSKTEHFEAVWVKNEWRRYMDLMKHDRFNRTLIPCYWGIDAKELPREMAHIQAQNLGKVGALQDLMHNIKKVVKLEKEQPAAPPPVQSLNSGKNHPLLRRALLELEASNFNKADACCEKLIDEEPENGWAYYAKMMCMYAVNTPDALAEILNINESVEFIRAVNFAEDDELKSLLFYVHEKYEANRPELQKRYDEEQARLKQLRELNQNLEAARKNGGNANNNPAPAPTAQAPVSTDSGAGWILNLFVSLLFIGGGFFLMSKFEVWWCRWVIAPILILAGVYISQFVIASIIFFYFAVDLAFLCDDVTSLAGKITLGILMSVLGCGAFCMKDEEPSNPLMFSIFSGIGIAVFLSCESWWAKGLIAPFLILIGIGCSCTDSKNNH